MSPAGLDAPKPEGRSSSGSLERLRLFLLPVAPRLAEDMLDRRGELLKINQSCRSLGHLDEKRGTDVRTSCLAILH
jgi:hypothetical protein